jgi:hypothetical protein
VDVALRVGLHSMTGASTVVTLDIADAAVLDPGMLLEHDGEMIQVVNAAQEVRGRQWSVRVSRGWGGTTTRRHDPAYWRIANGPARQEPLTIGPGQVVLLEPPKPWDCKTCGAPAQQGERCHYCRGGRP